MLTADQIISNAGSCAGASGTFAQLLCGWQAVMGIALVSSVVFLAALYIVSVMFRNDRLRNFVKIELSEVFITGLLVVILMGAVGAVSKLTIGTLLPASQLPAGANSGMTVYALTQTYFEQVGKDMGSWLEMNYVMGVIVDTFASVQSQPRPMGVGLVAPPFAGLASPFKQLLYNMSTGRFRSG